MALLQVLCVDVMGCYLGVFVELLIVGACVSLTLMPALDSFPHIGLPFSPSQEAFVLSLCIFLWHALLLSLGDPALS